MKIGLIGCGKQASKHIAGLQQDSGVEVAVCDIDAARAQAIAEKFGLAWSADVDAFLADPALTAVNIATPTTTHADLALRAIDAGKHFFCEKPLCRDLAEARRIHDRAAERGVTGMVGYVYRYSPVFEVGCRLSGDSAPLGAPVSALFRIGGRGDHEVWKHRRESNGGAIAEMLVHMLDLAIWYFGPISSIDVIERDLLRPRRVIGGVETNVDAEDFALVRCQMANGLGVYIQADLVTPAFSQYAEIQFERGSFMGSIQSELPSYVFATRDAGEYPAGKTVLDFGAVNLFERQMEAFCCLVRDSSQPDRNSLEDSLRVMEALEILNNIEVKT